LEETAANQKSPPPVHGDHLKKRHSEDEKDLIAAISWCPEMESTDSAGLEENGTGEEYTNYTLDPALCGNVTPEYERVSA
jgi:hypothetical protein